MKASLIAGCALLAFAAAAHAQFVGGYDSGSQPVQTATPNGSSHAAGSAVGCSSSTCAGNLGALFAVPAARNNGGANSGQIGRFLWTSTGGDATAKVVRIWDQKPTHTTCTDQVAFASSTADDAHLIVIPFSVTPAAPANTTGDAKTYTEKDFTPPASYKNQDSPGAQLVYICVVTGATDTADESSAVYVTVTGPQD